MIFNECFYTRETMRMQMNAEIREPKTKVPTMSDFPIALVTVLEIRKEYTGMGMTYIPERN